MIACFVALLVCFCGANFMITACIVHLTLLFFSFSFGPMMTARAVSFFMSEDSASVVVAIASIFSLFSSLLVNVEEVENLMRMSSLLADETPHQVLYLLNIH
jgi:hypothetical protein